MSTALVNTAIVLLIILVEAIFVASEIALISLREGQVAQLAGQGRRGAAVARLVSDPNRYLATVQIGVTLTALLSSAYGAVTLSGQARQALVDMGVPSGLAGFAGVVGVTLAISFVTLVIGELAPKRLALQRAEATARLMAHPLDRMATVVRPVIWLLSWTTDRVVRLFGGDPTTSRETITQEELRDLVAAHEALSTDERVLIDDVFAASAREVREVMVPRTEVDFLEASTTISRAVRLALVARHSRYPVVGENQDDVVGFARVHDLLDPQVPNGRAAVVGDIAREIKRLPGSKKVLAALSEMRHEGHHLAVVVDEYGGTDGIVTLEDLIEEVIGDIRDEDDIPTDEGRPLPTGEVNVDGLHNLDEFHEITGIRLLDGPYETAAGFVMCALGRLPEVGDTIEVAGRQITVTELDGRRVAWLRVAPPRAVDPASGTPEGPDAPESADKANRANAAGAAGAAGPPNEPTEPDERDEPDELDEPQPPGGWHAPAAGEAAQRLEPSGARRAGPATPRPRGSRLPARSRAGDGSDIGRERVPKPPPPGA